MSLPNFHFVSNDICRGAQPDRDGFIHLRETGVKSVLNLRSFHTDYFYSHGLKFKEYWIWAKAWHPEMEDMRQFQTIYNLAKIRGEMPIFVHCWDGKDRTGATIAFYRIKMQGWSKEDAIKEMLDPKFGSHYVWGELLSDFINKI